MLTITVPAAELWDSKREEFIYTKEQKLTLEHSLVSISKWESIWCKPFLSTTVKTEEETISYIKCMTIGTITDPDIYLHLSIKNRDEISAYIEAPMTAAKFFSRRREGEGRLKMGPTITSETIYSWMINYNIPFECEKWHLNRLLALVRTCQSQANTKKMTKKEIIEQNRALNASRKAALHNHG